MVTIADFHEAVVANDVAGVRAMLETDGAFATARHDGTTALHLAAIHGYRELAALLLDRGAEIDAVDDEYGASAAGWANEKGRMDMVEFLLERGARVSPQQAAAWGQIERLRKHLARDPSWINKTGGGGTALHEATVWGHPDIVELLLANGADASLLNRVGLTALDIARNQIRTGGAATPIASPERKREIVAGCQRALELLSRTSG